MTEIEGFSIAYLSLGAIAILLLVLLGIILRSFWVRRLHTHASLIVDPVLVILVGLFIATIFEFIGELYWIGVSEKENFWLMIGYSLYYATWVIGLYLLTRNTVRMPPERRKLFNLALRSISLIVLIAAATLFIIQLSTAELGENNVYTLFSFIALAFFGLLAFVFFLVVLRGEMNKNASKLVKARLYMLTHAIILQLLSFLVTIIGVGWQVFDPSIVLLSEVIIYNLLSIIMILTAILLYYMINIPGFIREKFGISVRRFDELKKMFKETSNQ